MRQPLTALIGFAIALIGYSDAHAAAPARTADEARCAALADQQLGPAARIVSAVLVRDGARPADVNWAGETPRSARTPLLPYCRVSVISMPARTSAIRVEVWLPASQWNGRMLGIGNGGYPKSIDRDAMAAGLARQFAVASTDLGLAAYLPVNGTKPGSDITEVFIENPTAIRDFASRATHEMTVIGKALVEAFYKKAPFRAYFAGCSTGGMQGMSESQRYPGDYDGILAGSPGGNRTRIHLGILWNYLAVWHRPERLIPHAKLRLLHEAALRECLKQERSPADQAYLRRPQDCRWDPSPLLCPAADGSSCLTAPQLSAAQALYQGPRNPRTGERYMPGLLPGSELGWALYLDAVASETMPYFGIFKAALGPKADPARFDWDRDAQTFIDVMGPQLDSASTDLRAYADRGGKLLFYQGGADQLASVTDLIDYLARTRSNLDGSSTSTPRSRDVVRLEIIPGMAHCGGGTGPQRFDGLGMLMRWTEAAH